MSKRKRERERESASRRKYTKRNGMVESERICRRKIIYGLVVTFISCTIFIFRFLRFRCSMLGVLVRVYASSYVSEIACRTNLLIVCVRGMHLAPECYVQVGIGNWNSCHHTEQIKMKHVKQWAAASAHQHIYAHLGPNSEKMHVNGRKK